MTAPAQEIETRTESGFRSGDIMSIVGGHFIHDTYTAFVAPLLPLLIDKLSLSLTMAGTLTAFMTVPSLLNPFIGYLADRVNLRIFVILAPGVSATLISIMGLAPSSMGVAAIFLLTGFSIAAFHAPAPAMIAEMAGRQVGKGMSLFMAGGELGRTIGPLVAVWAVSTWALENIYQLAVVGWAASLLLYWRLRTVPVAAVRPTGFASMWLAARRIATPLIIVVLTRSLLVTSLSVYLPTVLTQEGAGLRLAGGALSIFEFSGVVGALLGGTLSDRLGRKPVLSVALLASSMLLFALARSSGWMFGILLVGFGLISLSVQPVLLAIVQDHLNEHRALGNGLYLAMSFVIRSLAAIAIGAMGDRIGLRNAFAWSAIIGLLAVPAVFWLPADPEPA